MKRFNSAAFHRFLSDESGQATVEYVLILSFVVVVAGTISRTLMSTLDRSIGFLGAELEKQLRTGRLKVSAWNN